MAKLRLALWGLVAMAGGLYLGLAFFGAPDQPGAGGDRRGLVGGDFELVTTGGETFRDEDLTGKPYALFFGFTHCPDVCPTTLYDMSTWITQLGDDAANMSFVFVTVDPERDTHEVMADYVSAFSEDVIPLTGDVASIDRMKRLYRVYAAKVPLEDGDYTMDHTASVYLMDAEGGFVGSLSFGEPESVAVKALRDLMAG